MTAGGTGTGANTNTGTGKRETWATKAVDPAHVAHLWAVATQATDVEVSAAHGWYPRAKYHGDILSELSKTTDQYITRERAYCLIAVLSPNQDWSSNLRAAYDMVLTGNTDEPMLEMNRARGMALRHYDVRTWTHTSGNVMTEDGTKSPWAVVAGPKVTSFAHNIARPGQTQRVTIDRHALAAALNDASIDRVPNGQYGYWERVYIQFANEYGVSPDVAQALVWLVWRRIKPETRPRQFAALVKPFVLGDYLAIHGVDAAAYIGGGLTHLE